jgi:hypothetical protein
MTDTMSKPEKQGSEAVKPLRHSFVIRILRERGQPGWKGWVQHAGTGESIHVHTLESLLAFIEQRAGRLRDSAEDGLT